MVAALEGKVPVPVPACLGAFFLLVCLFPSTSSLLVISARYLLPSLQPLIRLHLILNHNLAFSFLFKQRPSFLQITTSFSPP